MEIIYYWYHHGDEEFEKRMMEIFENKDYAVALAYERLKTC